MAFCSKCGSELTVQDVFCRACGSAASRVSNTTTTVLNNNNRKDDSFFGLYDRLVGGRTENLQIIISFAALIIFFGLHYYFELSWLESFMYATIGSAIPNIFLFILNAIR